MIPSDEELAKVNIGLVRYARTLFRDYGINKLTFNEEDFAMQTMVTFLDKPTIYDETRGATLFVFLKKVMKNKLLNGISSANTFAKIQGTIVRNTPTEVNAVIDEHIDYEKLVHSLEKELEIDPVAHKIFLVIVEGLEKTDICKKFGYDDNTYYNGIRRIRTAYFKVRPFEKKKKL